MCDQTLQGSAVKYLTQNWPPCRTVPCAPILIDIPVTLLVILVRPTMVSPVFPMATPLQNIAQKKIVASSKCARSTIISDYDQKFQILSENLEHKIFRNKLIIVCYEG